MGLHCSWCWAPFEFVAGRMLCLGLEGVSLRAHACNGFLGFCWVLWLGACSVWGWEACGRESEGPCRAWSDRGEVVCMRCPAAAGMPRPPSAAACPFVVGGGHECILAWALRVWWVWALVCILPWLCACFPGCQGQNRRVECMPCLGVGALVGPADCISPVRMWGCWRGAEYGCLLCQRMRGVRWVQCMQSW